MHLLRPPFLRLKVTRSLPFWRGPVGLLLVMAAGMPLACSV